MFVLVLYLVCLIVAFAVPKLGDVATKKVVALTIQLFS